ncbi:hypothetical protein ACMFMG_001029 [Clarireedia jacksonii]
MIRNVVIDHVSSVIGERMALTLTCVSITYTRSVIETRAQNREELVKQKGKKCQVILQANDSHSTPLGIIDSSVFRHAPDQGRTILLTRTQLPKICTGNVP